MRSFEPSPAAGSPVFIGGINRSGTSLVRQILGSHPDLAIPPYEFEFFKRLTVPAGSSLKPAEVDELVDEVLHWPKVVWWEIDRALVRKLALTGEASVRGIFTAFLRAYAATLGKPLFGEKTTYYERHLGTFDRWFGGDYTCVHLLRHPVSTFASTRWYGGVERPVDPWVWARQWNGSALIALRARRSRLTGYHAVRYEDVVRDAERQTRLICEKARLPFSERMLSMADYEETENSSFALGPAADYVGALRASDDVDRASRIPDDQLAVVRRQCRVAAALIGYDVENERELAPFDRPDRIGDEWRLRASMATRSGGRFTTRVATRLPTAR